MPISYTTDLDLGITFELWTGEVSAHQLGDYWNALLADPKALAVRKTLVDLRSADLLFSGEDLSRLIESVAIPALAGRDWQSAIVVKVPEQFSGSKPYQVFAQHYNRNSLFYDYSAALGWLLKR